VRSIVPTLTFDTFEQALPAGVRAGTSGVRQLVYKTSEMSVDLRLEATGRGGRIVIAGQVGAPFDDGAAGARPTISVLQGSTELVTTTANEFGEFQCEFVAGDDLMLSIALADGSNFTISLDRLPIE
jgi:hypothetical protein